MDDKFFEEIAVKVLDSYKKKLDVTFENKDLREARANMDLIGHISCELSREMLKEYHKKIKTISEK